MLRRFFMASEISDEEIRAEVARINDKRAEDMAERFSRGNVSIQNRNFNSADSVDRVFGRAPWRASTHD